MPARVVLRSRWLQRTSHWHQRRSRAPTPIKAGVLGMQRTTMDEPVQSAICVVVMPAATDSNTALPILSRRPSQTARMTWGLTASSTQSASVRMFELSA